MLLQIAYWGMLKVALPIFPHVHTLFHTSEHAIHYLLSLSFILSGLSAIVWGPFIEYKTNKYLIFMIGSLGTISLIILSFSESFWVFGLFYLISCILMNSLSVYSRAFPVLYTLEPTTAKKSLMLRLCGGYNAAFIAPLLGGFIAYYWGWHYIFLVIIFWLILLYCLSFFIENRAFEQEKKSTFWLNFKQMCLHLKNKNFVRHLVILCCGNAVTQSSVISMPFWLERAYSIPVHQIAFYLFPLLLPGMRLPLLPAYIAKKVSEKHRVMLYMTLFILGGILPFGIMSIHQPPPWIWVIPGVLTNTAVVSLSSFVSYNALVEIKSSHNSASSLLSISSYLSGGIAMLLTLRININDFYLEGIFISCLAIVMCYCFVAIQQKDRACGRGE